MPTYITDSSQITDLNNSYIMELDNGHDNKEKQSQAKK